MKRYVYYNGRVVEEARARLSVFDRGLNYGDALFETMKAEEGEVRLIKTHMARLRAGAKLLGIPKSGLTKLASDIRAGALTRLLKKNGLGRSTASVRITVTRGVDAGNFIPKKGLKPTTIITARAVDELHVAKIQKRGIKGVLLGGAIPALAGVKTVNFLPNLLGRGEAGRRGASEGIFVDAMGYVLEGTASNIFIVKRRIIKTPPLSLNPLSPGVLPGTTRASVIKMARAKGIAVKETRVSVADLKGADEAFLTSSTMGIVPLVKIDAKKIGPGSPGPVTRALTA